MAAFRTGLFLTLGLAVLAGAVHAASETTLTFTPPASRDKLTATLIRPDGDGPFPAIAVMHDCSGLGPRASAAPRRYAGELVAQGYVVLIPDSFGPRNLPDGVCTAAFADARRADFTVRVGDALGALAVLRAQPFVDGRRVGIMGNSHGGATTLGAIVEAVTGDPYGEAKKEGFTAALALYPRCDSAYGQWNITGRQNGRTGPSTGYTGVFRPLAPLLILTGEKDDWTPAEPCRRLTEAAQAAGYPVEIKIYAGAHHAFDNSSQPRYVPERNNPGSPSGKGATTGGDPDAWADSRKQVAEFFAKHLKEGR